MAVVHNERFFVRALTGADVGIGEAYMDGDWSSPDLVALVRLVTRNLRHLDTDNRMFSALRLFAFRLRHSLKSNSLKGSRRNIQAHYDVGNDFYRLFLDREMLYSSAYFRTGRDSLEDAQRNKLDLICRKLRIEPGDRILEIGCGGSTIHGCFDAVKMWMSGRIAYACYCGITGRWKGSSTRLSASRCSKRWDSTATMNFSEHATGCLLRMDRC